MSDHPPGQFHRLFVLAALAVGMVVAAAPAVGAAPAESDAAAFDRDVRPILARHCVDCHGGQSTKAKLNLTSADALLRGAESGPVVLAGAAKQSLLVHLLAADGDPHMPPKGQLSAAEVTAISTWIDGLKPPGAATAATKPARQDHWSFRKVVRPEPPAVKDPAWVRNPIDAFVLAKLEVSGLAPAAEATRADLIRRATFDLTGLPPTPEEVDAFAADKSPDAYEKVIDRLLASPACGERWGRHWLDLARYADSGGFHNDIDRPNAWRYRDYVIAALNADKPYGRFVREQIAGDEFAPADPQALAATGFCRNGPSNEDNVGKDAEKYRLEELDDVVSTTSAVVLGLTVGCARCHDHKYDPIPQADYYRLLAVFNSTTKKDVPLAADGSVLVAAAAAKATTKPAKGGAAGPAVLVVTDAGPKPRPTRLLWRGDVKNPGPEVEPGVPAVLAAAPVSFPPPPANAKTTGRRTALADWLASPDNPLTWRVIANRLWHHHFGRGIVASTSNFGATGDAPTHPELLDWLAAETVARGGSLKAVHKLIMTSATYRQSSAWNAEAAAVDPENKLLWRASKRRLEAEAVRDSVLAVAGTLNRAAGGPGVKPRIPEDMLAASQRNKWPSVKREGPEHWRRSVYIYVKRQLQFPLLELFDAPQASQTCGLRQQSTVPTQALVLMNDEFTNEQAGHFAGRVRREAGDDPAKQAERALRLALGRTPMAERVAEATAFVAAQRAAHAVTGKAADEAAKAALADLCHVLVNCNEFVYVD
ncbi:MAG TPA: PSD1 and planctomycete cytochrome C domain-containing protein [Humisphaera sp.]